MGKASDFALVLESLRRAIQQRVVPVLPQMDDAQDFPGPVRSLLTKLGLLTLAVPEAYGGLGYSLADLCRVIEELARWDASVAVFIQAQATALRPILLAGNPEQRRTFFGRVVEEGRLFAFALTEPHAGSDAAAIATRAERAGDEYVLSGQKRFVTNGGIADYYLTFARIGSGRAGLTAFVIPAESPGLGAGKRENKMGLRASPTTDLLLNAVRVPATHRIGDEGQGFALLTATLTASRPTIAALAVGLAQGALDAAVRYALEREQFGQRIGTFQGIRFMLAEMATAVEAARALLYRAAARYDEGAPSPELSAMAKLFASDTAMRVTTDAVQILGGYGYLKDYPVERMMRDAKVTQIFEGTNQIMRLIIAKALLARSRA